MDDVSKEGGAAPLHLWTLRDHLQATTSKRNAFTANWLSQVSFDPPLMVALRRERLGLAADHSRALDASPSTSFPPISATSPGSSASPTSSIRRRSEGFALGSGETGCPVLLDTLAYVECEVESETPAGDSTLRTRPRGRRSRAAPGRAADDARRWLQARGVIPGCFRRKRRPPAMRQPPFYE